jgi:hypothetical protein
MLTTVQAVAKTTILSLWKLLFERFNGDRFLHRQYNNKREMNGMLQDICILDSSLD